MTHSTLVFKDYFDCPEHDCTSEEAQWSAAGVEYPCGAIIGTQLMFNKIGHIGHAIRYMHKQHHYQQHPHRAWAITDTVDITDGVVTLTAECDCP